VVEQRVQDKSRLSVPSHGSHWLQFIACSLLSALFQPASSDPHNVANTITDTQKNQTNSLMSGKHTK